MWFKKQKNLDDVTKLEDEIKELKEALESYKERNVDKIIEEVKDE